MTRKGKQALLAFAVLLVTSLIGAVVYSGNIKQKPNSKFYQPATVQNPPVVMSKIKDLQITGVNLINQGSSAAAVAIDVTNNGDSAVMSLDFVSGRREYSGLRIDGLLEEDNPMVLILPHALKTFTWSLGEIMVGETVFLAAATFADGKEEGDARSLEGIRKARTKFQLQQREAKAKNGGQ